MMIGSPLSRRLLLLALSLFLFYLSSHAQPDSSRFPYLNPDLPLAQRVDDLVSRMIRDEKVGQMLYNAPAIERLGISAYNWWNEALHGVATVISDEARAKHHIRIKQTKN